MSMSSVVTVWLETLHRIQINLKRDVTLLKGFVADVPVSVARFLAILVLQLQ